MRLWKSGNQTTNSNFSLGVEWPTISQTNTKLAGVLCEDSVRSYKPDLVTCDHSQETETRELQVWARSYISCCCDTAPEKRKLKKERFISVRVHHDSSGMAAWEWGGFSAERDEWCFHVFLFLLLFFLSFNSYHDKKLMGWYCPSLGGCSIFSELSLSVNTLAKRHRLLNLVSLTMKNTHCSNIKFITNKGKKQPDNHNKTKT